MTVSSANVTLRRATEADIPRFVELIAAANLPPLFIEQYLDGFVAAVRDGAVVACGGVEFYGGSAVIRSVVVDPGAQGLGLGRSIAEMLIATARERGTTDVYLLTGDALEFWRHMGFTEITFDDWEESPRACWQYQIVTPNLEQIHGIHTMRRVL
jgi:amino-acid N-acetyltransferase